MENSYSVRVIRVTREWFGTKKFYIPMVYKPSFDRAMNMQDSSDMPSVWGYESEDEAWLVIDQAILNDVQDEEFLSRSHKNFHKEDFHTDG